MNPLRILCLMGCLVAASMASPSWQQQRGSNSLQGYQDPSNWVSSNDIEQLPSLNEVTLKRVEQMSVEEGATMLNQLYHLAQVNGALKPTYVPEPSQVQGYIVTPRGEKIEFNLNNFVQTVRRLPNFGNEEVTIFITGLPQSISYMGKATRKLVQAYIQRYNLQSYRSQYQYGEQDNDNDSEEQQQLQGRSKQNGDNNNENETTGDLVVINLGDAIENFEQYTTFNVERFGALLGQQLVRLTDEANVPQEIIHLIGQGLGAHVAGVAGRQYTRQTGHKLRRITGLDPARLYAKAESKLSGLARGDADFVDAIHTSAYGMGSPERVGDVDFYPNGPAAGVPGADNVVEASLRATRYYAESVRPGNERNFPAVAATSYQEYKQNNGYGKRAYMGIAASYDIEGDYILQVNPKSPFGRNTPAQPQNGFHAIHGSWKQQQQNQQRLN
ncbi:vitellogenin-2 [Scaptodrosophila lebanonensis]|uniref:Vitellogenin-2 n=1 Tax=Drosophila lebanonensis TaxID=7225 RepID=A0A6J2U0Y6_DROLE|nr:vitellogenin-2 [Scaptodrosophila lebanonensis]